MFIKVINSSLPYCKGEILQVPDELGITLTSGARPVADEITKAIALKLWNAEIDKSNKLKDKPIGIHVEFLHARLPYSEGEQVWLKQEEVDYLLDRKIIKVLPVFKSTKK